MCWSADAGIAIARLEWCIRAKFQAQIVARQTYLTHGCKDPVRLSVPVADLQCGSEEVASMSLAVS